MDVLLIDTNDRTMLVRCDDAATADRVGSAAIYSDGGVSAYFVPRDAHDNVETIITRLQAGQDIGQIVAMEPLDEEEDRTLTTTYRNHDELRSDRLRRRLQLGMPKECAERNAAAWTGATGMKTQVFQNPDGTWDWDIDHDEGDDDPDRTKDLNGDWT